MCSHFRLPHSHSRHLRHIYSHCRCNVRCRIRTANCNSNLRAFSVVRANGIPRYSNSCPFRHRCSCPLGQKPARRVGRDDSTSPFFTFVVACMPHSHTYRAHTTMRTHARARNERDRLNNVRMRTSPTCIPGGDTILST